MCVLFLPYSPTKSKQQQNNWTLVAYFCFVLLLLFTFRLGYDILIFIDIFMKDEEGHRLPFRKLFALVCRLPGSASVVIVVVVLGDFNNFVNIYGPGFYSLYCLNVLTFVSLFWR